MIKKIVKLLIKSAKFRNELLKYTFDMSRPVPDGDEVAKLDYILSDSKGRKYFRYIRPEWLPYSRYEQMQVRLLEIESRVSRETLKLYAEAAKKAATKGDLITVARLAGELDQRLEMLYDPELFMKFLCGMLIREDQIKSAHIWNPSIEKDKYETLLRDNEGGELSFFFQKLNLSDHVKFSGSLSSGLEMLDERVIQNQLKEVRAFDQMLQMVSDTLSQKSPDGVKKEKQTL